MSCWVLRARRDAGSYKPTVGSVACTLYGVNTYGTTLGAISNTSCVACPGNSTSVGGSDKPNLCFCAAGYEQTKDFNACIECRPGFYDNITNRHECSMCGGGLYSAFWGAKGPETCKECGPGTWSNIGGATCQLCPPNTNSSVRSAFLTDCKCIAGTSGPDGQTCQFCESNTYKSVTGSASCTACPLNSQSPIGSTASSSCICNQGFTGPDGGNCTICEANTYKTVTGSAICTACPLNSQSPMGSIESSSCICNQGFTGPDGGNCTICEAHTYKTVTGSAICTACFCFPITHSKVRITRRSSFLTDHSPLSRGLTVKI